MKDLIEALTIFLKYKNPKYPTQCFHGVLYIMDVTEDEVSSEDQKRLEELSFSWLDDLECWHSSRFGNA